MSNHGKEEYWLIKRGTLDPYKVAQLVNKIRKDIKIARPEENQRVIKQLILRFSEIINCILSKLITQFVFLLNLSYQFNLILLSYDFVNIRIRRSHK